MYICEKEIAKKELVKGYLCGETAQSSEAAFFMLEKFERYYINMDSYLRIHKNRLELVRYEEVNEYSSPRPSSAILEKEEDGEWVIDILSFQATEPARALARASIFLGSVKVQKHLQRLT